MKTIALIVSGLVLICLVINLPLPAQQPPGSVWVPPHTLPGGETTPGHWRPPFKKGFYWVEGREDENGIWIPGHWNPLPGTSPEDQVWVPGYWDGKIWVVGYWRPNSRPGYIWIPHRWSGGAWQKGYWRAYKGGQPFESKFPDSQ